MASKYRWRQLSKWVGGKRRTMGISAKGGVRNVQMSEHEAMKQMGIDPKDVVCKRHNVGQWRWGFAR